MASIQQGIIHGPWGGKQGKDWTYMLGCFIEKITVVSGEILDRIIFQHWINGEKQVSVFGGEGGDRTDMICINYPDEYLTSIRGTVSDFGGAARVSSLCFVTNQHRYGPYGSESGSGTRFSYDGKGGMIIGFHGRADKYIDAIGIYIMPKSLVYKDSATFRALPSPRSNGPNCKASSSSVMDSRMSKVVMPRDAGPWGAGGGLPWDDGVFSCVKQVHVHVGISLNLITAVHFEYAHDDKSVSSQLHGGTANIMDGEWTHVVSVDGMDEYLTGVCGCYGAVEGFDGLEAIKSLTFYSNKTMYGPYGEECGVGDTYFVSTASPGKIVGFYGRSNGFLSALGVHMKYL